MNVPNEDAISAKYICRICSLVLQEPVQLKCGHRYCRLCITNLNEPIIHCLQCNEKTAKEEIVIDQTFKYSMETSSVTCLLCNWTDIWKNYQDHLKQNHSDIICNYCHVTFDSINDLDQHKKISCQNMMIYCGLLPYGCSEQFLRKNLFQHYFTEKHQCIEIDLVDQTKLKISQNKISNRLRELNEQVVAISKQCQIINNRIKHMNNLFSIRKPI